MKTDFLAELLTKNVYYWLIAKEQYGRSERLKDQILIIALPLEFVRERKREDIKLVELEAFLTAPLLTNIFISEPYPPFQIGIDLYGAYQGFPLDGIDFRGFMLDALELHSANLYDYKPLIEKHTKL